MSPWAGWISLIHFPGLRFPGVPGTSAEVEVLVGAGGVLAGPLVQLLALVAAGAVDVQAQSAVLVLELPGAVGLLLRQPQAGRGAADRLLHDVRAALGRGAVGHRDVLAGVLGLDLAVPAGGGHELELLVALPVAGPLIDRRTGTAGVAVHIQTQAVAGYHEAVITARESAAGAAAADRPGERRGP